MNSDKPVKGVIFDIGGVVVKSPFIAISNYEQEHRLPKNYINVALSKLGADGAFQRYERGEIAHDEFTRLWTAELNNVEANNKAYLKYLSRHNSSNAVDLPAATRIDGGELFARMMEIAKQPNECVVELIRELRETGYRVGALTNNFQNDSTSGRIRDELFLAMFDEFVESSLVGLRKPDPEFYRYACRKLGVELDETVFVDDIGANLRAARGLGMETVRVAIGKEEEAVDQIRGVLERRGKLRARL